MKTAFILLSAVASLSTAGAAVGAFVACVSLSLFATAFFVLFAGVTIASGLYAIADGIEKL